MKNRNYTVTIGTWVYRTQMSEQQATDMKKSLEPLVLNVEVREAG